MVTTTTLPQKNTSLSKKKLKRGINLLFGLVVFIPFIQLGYSVYISVQFLGVILLVALLLYWRGAFRYTNFFLLLFFMLPSLVPFVSSELFGQDILRLFREFLNILLFLSVIENVRRVSDDFLEQPKWFPVLVQILVFSLLVFTVAQIFAVRRQFRLWLPLEWYAIRDNLLPDQIDIQYGVYTGLRPTAFFTEPSYLGFVIFALLVLVWYTSRKRKRAILVVTLFFNAFLSRSLLGMGLFLSMLALLAVDNYVFKLPRKKRFHFIYIAGIALVAFFVVIISSGIIPVFDRLLLMIQDPFSNQSTMFRIIDPLRYAFLAIQSYPFGIPYNELSLMFNAPTVNVDNAILGLFTYYGVFAPLMLVYIAFRIKDIKMFVFFFFCAFYNGVIFFYDKTLIMTVVMSIYFLSPNFQNRKGNVG